VREKKTNGRLGDVCRVIPGYAFKSSDWCDKGIPVVKIKNIKGDTSVDLSYLDCVPESVLTPKLQKFVLVDGDILVAMTGATAGKVGKVRTCMALLLNQRVAKIQPVEADHDFIWSVVSSHEYQETFFHLADGAAQPNMSGRQIESVNIPLPPLPVQRRIAGILSAYDDLIENSQRRIRILEAMARALYREWFVHFRFPGHEKLSRIASPLGDIPEGWEVRKLGEIADITMGLSPKGNTYNEVGDGTPLINGPVEFGDRFTKQVKWTTAPTKTCRNGDLIVCVRGSTTGKYVKSDGVYCLGRGVCGLSSSFQCFIDLLFENELPTLLSQTSGSTFPSWTGPQLKNHPVLFPPQELLTHFEILVKPMAEQVLSLERQIQNLHRTRNLLLPRLLSGQTNIEAA